MISMIIITGVTGYFVFQSSIVQTRIISSISKRISQETNADVSIGKVDIALFRKIILEEVYLSDQQKDTLFYVPKLMASIDSLSFRNKKIHFKSIRFNEPHLHIQANDSSGYNFNFLLELLNTGETPTSENWRFNCSRFELKNGHLLMNDARQSMVFNQWLTMEQFNLTLDDFRLNREQQLSVHLETLSFASENEFLLNNCSASLAYADSTLSIANIQGASAHSSLEVDSLVLHMNRFIQTGKLNDLEIMLDIHELDFNMRDLACFLGPGYDKDLRSKISGRIQGDVFNFRGKDFKLSVENFTHLNGDFYINDLSELRSAYIFLDLNESYANLNEIRNLDLPPRIQQAIDNLPKFLDNVGTFSYQGNFTGFIDDFVAYGTAYSNLGIITSDISFKPVEHERIKVNGHIATENLHIGRIFGHERLDQLSLSGEVNGTVDYHSNYDLTFDGVVDSIDFNQYSYHHIKLAGRIQNSRFNGDFAIADPNLHMTFSGKLDLSPELPVFEFVSNVEHANLFQLHLLDDEAAIVRMDVDANFEGSNIDNVRGNLSLSNVLYQNKIDEFQLQSLQLNNAYRGGENVLTIESDWLDGHITGQYKLMSIGKSFIAFYQQYLPSSSLMPTVTIDEQNDFAYRFHIKDVNSLSKLVVPELSVEPDFYVEGYYKPLKDSVFCTSTIPMVQYANRRMEQIRLNITGNRENLLARVKTDKFSIGERFNLYNVSVESHGRNDQLDVNVFWNNYGEETFSGKLKTHTRFKATESRHPSMEILIEPSAFYFSDSIWTLNETHISIDSSTIRVNKLDFHHNDQRLHVEGIISKDETAILQAKIENIDLLLFEPFMGSSYFGGKLNGYLRLSDAYEKIMLDLDLLVDELSYNGSYLGELAVSSKWDNQQENLNSAITLLNNNRTIFKASGNIDPLNNQMDMNLLFDNSPVSFLQVFMPSTFNNQQGHVNGQVHLHGKTYHIKHDGVLTPVHEASIGLSYLNTTYFFSDPVYFEGDSIIFRNIRFNDELGNSGFFSGSLKHQTFNNMVYNMQVVSNNLLALNTTAADNNYFYGTAFISGNLDITGEGSNILLAGDLRSQKGSNLYIPYESGENAEQYDFIEFINHRTESKEMPKYQVNTTGLDMNFDVELTPEAKIQIIFNSQVGDVIKGTGSGNLQIRVDRNYNINIYGNYVINEGDYLFTLQNVINKRFTIQSGSTMEWVGDPYDALINIKAVYKVKTSLYDLFVGDYQDIDLSRRIPVDCIIQLTENLMTPKIDFTIELPTVEERIKDEVSQLIVTREDINKQFISLLMLGRFYTPEFFAGRPTTETSAELFGTTASELFSNQLSNWLSKISDVWDLGFNYRPGNEISNDQIELALSTQILNDRVTIDGNIGNNANPNATNNNVVGDFDVNVKLTDNGKLQLKAYNHANDNIIYMTEPNTWGIGLSYREEFNNFKELPERFKTFIQRTFKRNKSEDPPETN
ncbi:MAG: translocation/assembly module TamB domain-containing protein [Prolixibacteraceae bacterium]|nr:translocation/assembly module TamB domain-containing protein [Prolixibacteraceae bacterium]